MKTFLTYNFLLMATCAFAQIKSSRYDFNVVKGVDSISVESVAGTRTWKEVYHYKNSRRFRMNYYDSAGLLYYRLFQFNDKLNQSTEAYFGKSSRFDADKNVWVEFWDSTSCHLTIMRYKGDKIKESLDCRVIEADTIVNRITTYQYDKNQRIQREFTRDVFVGLVGTYKSNEVDLKQVVEKTETTIYSIDYRYEQGKVEVVCKVNQIFTGKEIRRLGIKGECISTRQWSDKNVLLSETSTTYYDDGKLKSTAWKTHSPVSLWGQEGDFASDGYETIEYDKSGRPLVGLIFYTGSVPHRTVYKYY